jgi:tellurite resistance protein
MRDILKDREHGDEAVYFRKQDEKLLQKIRERAALEEVAQALAEKLRVDDRELLNRVVDLGLTRDTGAAILLAPLVQVAWAEGSVSPRERKVVLEIAASRGVEAGSGAHRQIESWLAQRPSDALFETALEVLKAGLAVLPEAERNERIQSIVAGCARVAEATGGGLAKLLGLSTGIVDQEAAVLDAIGAKLRSRDRGTR